jgi:hypothetical protein
MAKVESRHVKNNPDRSTISLSIGAMLLYGEDKKKTAGWAVS